MEIYVNGAHLEFREDSELRERMKQEHRRATRAALQESHTNLRRMTAKRINSRVREIPV